MADDITWDIIHHPDLRDGIVSYYKCEEDSRDTYINYHHGTEYNTPTDVAGIIERARNYNGTTQYTDVLNDGDFNTTTMSISVWVKLASAGGSGWVSAVAKESSLGGDQWDDVQWSLKYYRNEQTWVFIIGGASAVGSATAAGVGTTNWMHIVGTYDGINCKIYIDGVLVDSNADSAGDIVTKTFPIVIAAAAAGADPFAGRTEYLAASIDEIGLWNRALTAPEVALIYGFGDARTFDMLTAGWWDVNTGSTASMTGPASIAFDPQTNTNDITIMAYCRPETISGSRGIFSKYYNLATLRSYKLGNGADAVSFTYSVNGTNNAVALALPAVVVINADAFYCGRYEYKTPTTSESFVQYNDVTNEKLNGGGPLYSSDTIGVELWKQSPTAKFIGRMYWTAYWNRKLSDAEVLQIRTGEKTPWELRADFYIDYHQAVGSTYTSELPQSVNAWTFSITGTPVKDGSAQITLPNPLGLVSVEALDPTDLNDMGFRTEAPLASSIERGVVYPQPEPEMVNSFSRTEQQVESARHRGIAPIIEHDRKKGR